MALPIALQVYSVRDFAEKDFKETMEKVKAMGYEGVELAGLYGHTAPDENKVELFSSASRLTVSSLLLPLYTILK